MSDNGNSRAQPAYLSAALLCLAALVSGCGSDSQQASYLPIPGCESVALAPCDTMQLDCQKSRLEIAACL